MKTNAHPGDTVDVQIIRRSDTLVLKNCKVMESKWTYGRVTHVLSHPDVGEFPANDKSVIHSSKK